MENVPRGIREGTARDIKRKKGATLRIEIMNGAWDLVILLGIFGMYTPYFREIRSGKSRDKIKEEP